MKRLISELQRRRVFRTAALYIVGAWLLLQVADVVFPALDVPDRALRYVLFGALLGFPAVLVFGWFFDISAHGISRTHAAGPEEAPEPQALRRTDFILLAALAAVAVAIIYSMVGRVVDEPGIERRAAGDGPPMVAVLPFTAASLGGDSDFFAVGIHDDLLTRLAQLESLRVISRTSVLEFKNTVRNIRDIGAQLGADVILEGGIQSAGDRIRINAQLIDARTDEHLWAHTYDRALSAANIFDVQAEIARAIAAAMHATLTPQDVSQLAVIPTENMAAYREFRRALEIRAAGSIWKNVEYQQALERAVELDPHFTRAMAELVGSLSFTNFFHPEDDDSIPRAEAMLERIRVLAPDSADHLIAKYYYTYYTLKDYPRAYQLIKQAESLRPSDIDLLDIKTYIQRRVGDFESRIETIKKLIRLDPLNTSRKDRLLWNLVLTHQYDEAETTLEADDDDRLGTAFWRAHLSLREHRDMNRWAKDLEDLWVQYEDAAIPYGRWDIKIATRDFAGAKQLLSGLDEEESDMGVYFSEQTASRIITLWFLGDEKGLSEMLPGKRAFLEQSRDSEGNFVNLGTHLQKALIAAAEGNVEEVRKLVRFTLQEANKDKTSLSAMLAESCELLGMVGATVDAVNCLRRAFTEPSAAQPFLEPFLPFYDPIRADPAFIELLEEFNQVGWYLSEN